MRLGVIGYGDAGSDFLKAALYVDGWEAAGVGGRNMEKAAACGKELNVPVLTVDEMVADKAINIIAVTTPPGARMPDCLKVLDAGKHLIVEKPMALNVADCDLLIDRAKQQQVQLMLAHSTSFFPAAIKARELIETGEIGDIVSIEEDSQYNYFSAKRVGWQVDPVLSGGGVVMNPVTHMVNRIRYLAGAEVSSVYASVGYRKPEHPDIDGDVNALLYLQNGVRATISMNGYGHNQKFFACTIKGTLGSIHMEGWNAVSCFIHKNEDSPPVKYTGYSPLRSIYDPANLSYALKLEIWKKNLEAGREPFSGGYNGRQNVAVCQAMYESSRTKKPVKPG